MWTEDMPLRSGAGDLTASRGVHRQGLSVRGTDVLSDSILLESCPGKSKPPLQRLLGEAGPSPPTSSVTPLACMLPSVPNYRILCSHWGFDNSLPFFFCNCRIIKYFNFKVSNFLLHT